MTDITLNRNTSKDIEGHEDLVDSTTLYNITDDENPTQALLQAIWPIGSIYIGTMNVCPLAALFGTWEKVAEDRVLQGAGTRGAVGTTLNESLPNITGRSGWIKIFGSGGTGVFTKSTTSSQSYTGTSSQSGESGNILFDASDSSPTYQDNAPVQQDAFLVNIWKRTA